MVNAPGDRSHSEFRPDYAIPPGATLREELDSLGMSQSDLALRTGLSLKHVNQIVQGSAPITQETALAFEKVLGIPAEFWNAREARYRELLARHRDEVVTEEDLEWLNSMPTKELAQRGFVSRSRDKGTLLQEVYRFFGVANRETWDKVWRTPLASFRRSMAFKSDSKALAAWLRIGELQSQKIDCRPFDAKSFRRVLHEIRALTLDSSANASRELVRLCSESGVALVLVPEIKGTRVSGAAYWMSPTKAVIQLSDRYKQDDRIWFSFFHEAGHLLLHGKKETYISRVEKDEGSEEEDEANRFAELILIPREFETELRTLRSNPEIEDFADRIGIAPGIVVGRLQNEKILDWSKGITLKRSIRIVETPDDD